MRQLRNGGGTPQSRASGCLDNDLEKEQTPQLSDGLKNSFSPSAGASPSHPTSTVFLPVCFYSSGVLDVDGFL